MQRPRPETVTLDDILITEELSRRSRSVSAGESPPPPNLLSENQALHTLARQLVNQPETMLQTLVDIVLDFCCAGTAGVSLLETTPNGEEIFRWNVLAGALAQYVGGTTPRNFSPCGVCLERGTPVLFSHPERYFTYFQAANTPIVEELVLPLVADRHVLGTIWILSHDQQRHFDSEDLRVMTSLAEFTAAALLLDQRQTQELRLANTQLATLEERHRVALEAAELGTWDWHIPANRVIWNEQHYRLLGLEPRQGEETATSFTQYIHPEDLPLVNEQLEHAIATNGIYQADFRIVRADTGEIRWMSGYGRVIETNDGQATRMTGVMHDSTHRHQIEQALRESEEQLAVDLADTKQLEQISSQWIQEEDINALYQQILDAAIALMRSDMGSMQMLYPERNELRLLAWKGFDPASAAFWEWVQIDSGSTCGVALDTGKRVIAPDVETCEFMAGTEDLDAYRLSGIKAVQSTPLISRSGRVIGMISNHWREPYQPLERELGLLDVLARQAADLIEQRQAAATLRESEEKYRSLFSSIDEGYFLCDMIFDENDLPIDILYLDANRAAIEMVGQDFTGRRLRDINPNYEPYWYEIFGRVARTGEGERLERYAAPDDKWYSFYVVKVSDDNSRIAVVFQDITERKRREANLAFLADITDELSRLSTVDEIMQAAGAKIARYLNLAAVNFLDIDDAGGWLHVNYGWAKPNLPSVLGTHRIEHFLNEEWKCDCRAGKITVIRDTQTDPRTNAASYAPLRIGAFVNVPFNRGDEWKFILSVYDTQARDWRDDEIELFRELSNCIFPRLDRARAEEVLRESEARMQKAFSAETVGVLFFSLDGGMQDANETFTGMSGYTRDELQNAVHWETLTPPEFRDVTVRAAAELAEKGETAPYEKQLFRKDGSRWWGLFAPTRLSGSGLESQCVEFIIDITDRKQAEEALRESKARIAADLAGMRRLYELQSKLADQNDVKAALQDVLTVACEFTGTDRGCVQLLSGDGERLEMVVWQGYADDGPFISFFRYEGLKTGCEVARVYRQRMIIEDTVGFPGLEGTDAGAASHADGIRASQSTPMASRSGETIGVISTQFRQPHRSSDHELRLMDMLAWTAGEFLERHRANAALRQSEAKYRTLFNSIDEGYYLLEVIFDERGEATDVLFLDANPTSMRMSGGDRRGKRLREVGNYEAYWYELYGRVARTGVSERTEQFSSPAGIWVDTYTFKVGEEGNRVATVFQDVTERKRREANAAFLADLTNEFTSSASIDDIMQNVGAKIGAYMKVVSVVFTDVDETLEQVTVSHGWMETGTLSIVGNSYRLEEYVTPEFGRLSRAGEMFVVSDTQTDPRTDAALYAALQIHSWVVVPFHRDGEWRYYLTVYDAKARDWREDEIELFREIANRVFPSLDRARAEDALRESEVKYRSLFESINDGFCVIEMIFDENEKPVDYRFVEISPSFERQTGMVNALGKRMRELAPDHEAYWFETYGNVALTGQPTRFENSAGQLHHWFDIYAFPVGEPENRRVAIVFNDITNRKQAEENRIQLIQEQAAREEERQRAEALAELDRAKTIFFSNVSHEFRTPLTLLLAPLQDALSDRVNPLAPPHRERLQLAYRNSLRLLKLVNTLLDFSRIEAGRMEAVYEATDLALLTTELASVFRSAIERAGLRLIVDCPPLPEPVYVDREMWEKIVLNLLSNAFKFTFAGEIAIRLHPADDYYVTLQVQDTGTGIPPEELPHLFERFYQVRGAKARTHEGSGIGLALVHELIRLHGGTVDVSSTVGQGTCFTVTIPLGTVHLPNDRIQAARTLVSTALGAAPYVEEAERWLPQEEGGSEEEKEGRREGGKLSFTPSLPHSLTPSLPHSPSATRILLVDDNADMRDYLTRILSEHVQVEAVADGAAALAAAQERVPDLILSDVMMPGLDGFELLKALRADPCTREVPIILLSARAGEESVVEGLQAGADDYLIKPFSATELVTRVLAHLQIAHLRLEALRQERTTSRRKDEMLSTVSHELNTPLVAILGWTRLLRTSPLNQSMLMKSLETIERNATLQAKLISDLLDISRITAGKLRLNLEPVELQSVISMAIATVHQSLQTKDIQLSSLLEPLPTIIQGDPDRLQQIVLNLLTNAIKFTPKGGIIDIRLETTETQAQIKVSDTGCGIAAEFLPYVFDHFRQAENSRSTKGLGLGLAIALHLVELHSGTIEAESLGLGQGATFTVNFPVIGVSLE